MYIIDGLVVCVLKQQRNVTAAVNAMLTAKAANAAVTNRRGSFLASSQPTAIDTKDYGSRRQTTDTDPSTPRSGYLRHDSTHAVILITADKIWPTALQEEVPDLFELPGEGAARDVLIAAIRTAMAQNSGWVEVANSVAQTYPLTAREREVLEHMIAGETSKGIARILRISPRTVQVYRGRVLAKLSARNATEAVRIALVSGANA